MRWIPSAPICGPMCIDLPDVLEASWRVSSSDAVSVVRRIDSIDEGENAFDKPTEDDGREEKLSELCGSFSVSAKQLCRLLEHSSIGR